ncbi:MAG: hypothetical protein AAF710_06090 [Planctomycetota bacterium]
MPVRPLLAAAAVLTATGCATDPAARIAEDARLAEAVRADDAPRYVRTSTRGVLQRTPPPEVAPDAGPAEVDATLARQVREAQYKAERLRDRRRERFRGGPGGGGG